MIDLRPYKSTSARLSDWLPWAALVAPGIVLNKDGSFQRTLAFRGPDLDSSTPSELMGAAARFDNALRRLGAGWCVHVEARRGPAGAYPESQWPDGLSWLIDEERRDAFSEAGARFESRYFLTLTYLPPSERSGKLEAALFDDGRVRRVDYRACLDRFIAETQTLLDLLALVFTQALFLDSEETLTFLHGAISDRPHRVAVPPTAFHLDELLADTPFLGGASPSGGAEGQTSAIQASNQMLGVLSAQLAEMQALQIAQSRALAAERLERAAREERALEIQRRAFPTTRAAPPPSARTAF